MSKGYRTLLPLLLLFAWGIMCPAAEKLVIISPHWEGVKIETARAFKEWYNARSGTDIDIEWMDQGGTSDDVRFVESLFKKTPNGIGIDIFFGGGMDPFLKLKEKGLLQRYKVPDAILNAIPPKCLGIPNYDTDHYWYGVVLSGFGILVNKRALAYLSLPIPRTWEDLANPAYFSWVGAADPRHSGTMHMMFEIILQAYGWEKGWKTIFALAGNTKNFSASASQVSRDTAIGEVAVSLCVDSYGLTQVELSGRENMEFILPEGVTIINPDAIAILKGTANYPAACRFIDFLLSDEGQLLWMLRKGAPGGPKEYPLTRLSIRPDTIAACCIAASTISLDR